MNATLLNTREAARYLRVSEASIRRWTDAGLLASQRVGRRHERRFTEDDLRAFMSRGRQPAPGRAVEQPPTMVRGVPLVLPSHLATFFSSDAGRVRIATPFLSDGLRAGQTCFVAATGRALDCYRQALTAAGIDVDAAATGGRLLICSDFGPTAADAIAFWDEAWGGAIAGGPIVLRMVGDMFSVARMLSSTAEMIAFEEALGLLAERYPVAVLCQYDVREIDGPTLLSALKAHPDLFDFRLGTFLA